MRTTEIWSCCFCLLKEAESAGNDQNMSFADSDLTLISSVTCNTGVFLSLGPRRRFSTPCHPSPLCCYHVKLLSHFPRRSFLCFVRRHSSGSSRPITRRWVSAPAPWRWISPSREPSATSNGSRRTSRTSWTGSWLKRSPDEAACSPFNYMWLETITISLGGGGGDLAQLENVELQWISKPRK